MSGDDRDALIDAGTALLGIPVQPEWRAGIRLYLDMSLAHAANAAGFPLPDEAEPAPVFVP
jgi:hypothetical protein